MRKKGMAMALTLIMAVTSVPIQVMAEDISVIEEVEEIPMSGDGYMEEVTHEDFSFLSGEDVLMEGNTPSEEGISIESEFIEEIHIEDGSVEEPPSEKDLFTVGETEMGDESISNLLPEGVSDPVGEIPTEEMDDSGIEDDSEIMFIDETESESGVVDPFVIESVIEAETDCGEDTLQYESVGATDGIFVGDFEDYNEAEEVVIDGVAYPLSEDCDYIKIAGVTGNILIDDVGEKDSTVVFQIKNGKLVTLDLLSSVLNPSISVNAVPDTLLYRNGTFDSQSTSVQVSVNCRVDVRNSPFTVSQLEKVDNLAIPVKMLTLSFDSDVLNFGKSGVIFKKEVTEKNEKELMLSLNKPLIYNYDVYVKEGYIPDNVSVPVVINGQIQDKEGKMTACNSTVITVGNLDLQIQKNKSKNEHMSYNQSLVAATKELNSSTAIALDGNLSHYFTEAQQVEIKKFLTIYFSEVLNANKLADPSFFDKIADKISKKVRDKILGKLGVSYNTFLFAKTTDFRVGIEGTTISGKNVTVEFSGKIDDYSIGDNDPYAAMVSFNYKITDKKAVPNGASDTGTGMATFANLESFANSMLDFLKIAYNEAWGKKADEIASMIISKPVNKLLLGGSFSGKIYKLCTDAAKSSTKKVSVHCPVDLYVYSADGSLCGKIVDNQVDCGNQEVVLSVNGDDKYIYIAGGEYYIRLVGNDYGIMEYAVEEYEGQTLARTVKTQNVSLNEGIAYETLVTDIPYVDQDVYALYPENSEDKIPLTYDSYQSQDHQFSDITAGGDYGNVKWYLDLSGVMQISGNGRMEDFREPSDVPWEQYCLQIKYVLVEDGVTNIASYAFSGCENLKAVKLADSVVSIGTHAFSGCTGVEGAGFLDGVTYIGDYAFSGCIGLTFLPDTWEHIGKHAFDGCTNLKSVSLGDKSVFVGEDAFSGTKYDGKIAMCGLYICWQYDEAEGTLTFSGSGTKSYEAFLESELADYNVYCDLVNKIIIKEGITEVWTGAFEDFENVTSVTLPESIENIGEFAFERMTALPIISIPDKVSKIEKSTFRGCINLQSVIMGKNVKEICSGAFYGCTKLAQVDFWDEMAIEWVEWDAFYGTKWLNEQEIAIIGNIFYRYQGDSIEVNVPDGIEIIGGWAFYDCDKLININLPDSITVIGEYAFRGCSSIVEIEIPSSVKTIGKAAFCECSGLKKETIPNSVESVGDSLFMNCHNLEYVSLPDGIERIGNGMFVFCNKLPEISLPTHIKEIGQEAFLGCVNLSEINFPDSLNKIEIEAFNQCTGLSSVVLPAGVVEIGKNVFRGCRSLEKIMVSSENSVYSSVDGVLFSKDGQTLWIYPGGKVQTEYSIPEGTIFISDKAFSDCCYLKGVRIPTSMITIGEKAFKVYGGKYLVLPKEVSSIVDSVASLVGNDYFESDRNIGIKNIYYAGSQADWEKIQITCTGSLFRNANLYFSSSGPCEENDHEWDGGSILQEATCSAEGVKKYICLICGETKTEPVWKCAHTWNEGFITTAATCVKDGLKTYTCIVCGSTKTESVSKSGIHTWDAGVITKAASCMEDGVKTYTCTVCGITKTETIPKSNAHIWGDWTQVSKATVLVPESQQRICSICGTAETRTGDKLAPSISVNASSLKLKKGQATSAFKVTGLADGDSVKTVTSSNTKVLKVTSYSVDGAIKLKAQKKTGKAKLTITLESGLTKTIAVKVQKKTVKTSKLKVVSKNVTLSKGGKLDLKAAVTPITSQQKVTYKSSNKKVASVNSRGVITAKKPGKAKITVKSGSKKVTVTVKVTK